MKTLLATKPELLTHHQKGIGHTALHWAASANQYAIAEWLLAEGAKVDATNASDATPLHAAAGAGHLALVERLLVAGASTAGKDDDGLTPASLAASRGHAEVAAALR